MEFEWDDAKNRINQEKHGISFERAISVFEGFYMVREDNRFDYGERRYLALGQVEEVVILAVVYTERNRKTRIISARQANKIEKVIYYEALRERTDG